MSIRSPVLCLAACFVLASCKDESSSTKDGSSGIDSSAVTPKVIASDVEVARFLDSLQAMVSPFTDSLEARVERIRSDSDSTHRDEMLDTLRCFKSYQDRNPLDNLLEGSVFRSRRWVNASGRADSSLNRKAVKILAKAGLQLSESDYPRPMEDLWTRKDLFQSFASPAQMEWLSIRHEEIETSVLSGGNLGCSVDVLVQMILRRELLMERHPTSIQVSWAERDIHEYLELMFIGAPRTPAWDGDRSMKNEFLEGFKYLARNSKGPAGDLAREWLSVLKTNHWIGTSEVGGWITDQGFMVTGSAFETFFQGE